MYLADVTSARHEKVRVDVEVVQAEADDSPRVDANSGRVNGALGIRGRIEGLGHTSYLQTADAPRIGRDDVVHHESYLRVYGKIAEFSAGGHVESANVDCAGLGIVAVPNRIVLQRPVWLDSR